MPPRGWRREGRRRGFARPSLLDRRVADPAPDDIRLGDITGGIAAPFGCCLPVVAEVELSGDHREGGGIARRLVSFGDAERAKAAILRQKALRILDEAGTV